MISPEDKRSDDGAKQARLAARAAKRREEEENPDEIKTMTPLEWKDFKINEALNVRSQLDRLRREAQERWREERKFQQ